MSFPYTTSAAPPTNGPLPVVESANLSSGPYGGGGGGPIGPNPVVSSITFAPNIAGPNVYTQGVLNMSTQLVIQDPGTLVVQDYFFQTGLPTPVDFTSSFVSTTNSFVINGPGGDGNNGGMNLVGSADGRSMITALTAINVVSSLAIVGDPVVIPFNLQVSSINGAAPSGGVPPQIAVSSINVNSQGYIEMYQDNTNSSGRIIGYGDINNTSSISLAVGFVAGYASKINGTDGLWCVENDSTGANQAYGDFGAGRFAVLGNNAGASKSVPVLDSDGAGNLDINAEGAVNISTTSFTVNGAPVGGGYAPFFSTLNQTPSTINCDGNTTQVLLSFSTTAGHLYQIQTQMTIQGNGGQEGTANDDVVQEVLNQIYLNTTQGSFISTANAATRDVGIGTCGMWKSNLTGTSLTINGTFSTTIQLGNVYLTDFGPV